MDEKDREKKEEIERAITLGHENDVIQPFLKDQEEQDSQGARIEVRAAE